MRQLSPQDVQFLYVQSEQNLTHVSIASIFDPGTVPGKRAVQFEDIVSHVKSRLHVAPMLRRRLKRLPLELDYPYWVDDEAFDLEHHLSHTRLSQPGDWRQFCTHLAHYHSQPLDMDKPLWEMHMIDGLNSIEGLPKSSFAIVSKMHHAAVDGALMMRFLSALMDSDTEGTPALEVQAGDLEPSPPPGTREIARRATWNNLRWPLRVGDSLLRATPGIYRAARRTLSSRDRQRGRVPDTRFNVPVSPDKNFAGIEFTLESLGAIRSLLPACKFNDVVLGICSGALRRYLESHGELPEQSLVAWVPIDNRSADAQDSAATGNDMNAMTVAIHTDMADPLQRLQAIYATTLDSKQARSGLSARVLTDLTRHAPAATQRAASLLARSTRTAARFCNLFISNVPGPRDQLYMNGARQHSIYGMAPLSNGIGLFIATPSYRDKMSFGVTSTSEILPDIDFFMDCLRESHAELLALATAHEKKSGSPKSVGDPGDMAN